MGCPRPDHAAGPGPGPGPAPAVVMRVRAVLTTGEDPPAAVAAPVTMEVLARSVGAAEPAGLLGAAAAPMPTMAPDSMRRRKSRRACEHARRGKNAVRCA